MWLSPLQGSESDDLDRLQRELDWRKKQEDARGSGTVRDSAAARDSAPSGSMFGAGPRGSAAPTLGDMNPAMSECVGEGGRGMREQGGAWDLSFGTQAMPVY